MYFQIDRTSINRNVLGVLRPLAVVCQSKRHSLNIGNQTNVSIPNRVVDIAGGKEAEGV